MFCTKCGKEIPDGTKFCPGCGADLSAGKQVQNAASEFFNSAEQQVGSAINEVKQSFSNDGSNNAQYNNSAQDNAQYNNGAQFNNGAQYNNGAQFNNGAQYNNGTQFNNGAQFNNGGQYNMNNNAPRYTGERLQDDRGLVSYILLSLITCGIYSYYFIYKMAHDVNVACDGDGESTGGLVAFILLSFITCGIYAWVWYYKLGNRLCANAPRYGLHFQENGTTVLLWLLLGSWVCGLGAFVAMHILIKNSNMICNAYNRSYGM